jgi:hypothetical protein
MESGAAPAFGQWSAADPPARVRTYVQVAVHVRILKVKRCFRK